MEDATTTRHVQEFFKKKLEWWMGKPMTQRISVFENAVLDKNAERLHVELKNVGKIFQREAACPLNIKRSFLVRRGVSFTSWQCEAKSSCLPSRCQGTWRRVWHAALSVRVRLLSGRFRHWCETECTHQSRICLAAGASRCAGKGHTTSHAAASKPRQGRSRRGKLLSATSCK